MPTFQKKKPTATPSEKDQPDGCKNAQYGEPQRKHPGTGFASVQNEMKPLFHHSAARINNVSAIRPPPGNAAWRKRVKKQMKVYTKTKCKKRREKQPRQQKQKHSICRMDNAPVPHRQVKIPSHQTVRVVNVRQERSKHETTFQKQRLAHVRHHAKPVSSTRCQYACTDSRADMLVTIHKKSTSAIYDIHCTTDRRKGEPYVRKNRNNHGPNVICRVYNGDKQPERFI